MKSKLGELVTEINRPIQEIKASYSLYLRSDGRELTRNPVYEKVPLYHPTLTLNLRLGDIMREIHFELKESIKTSEKFA